MNIKVISEKIIKPSSPTPKHLRLLRASLIDQVNSPVLMPLVFFYNSQKSTTKIDTRQVLDRLHGSLPETLSIFYPLGGRVLDENFIECNDEGVPYIETKVEKPLLELKNVVLKAKATTLLDKLVPPYGQGGYTSLLLAIQVSIFPCGGLAIGVKMNHAISDAFSIVMFVKTWTSIANKNLGSNLHRPCFDTWRVFPPSLRQKIQDKDVYANHNPDLIRDVPVTKLFLFSEAKLLALRSKVFSSTFTSDVGRGKTLKPSLAMVLSAFIWSRVKVACHSCGIREYIPHEVFHAVNLRPNLALPDEQSYYFGNMVVNAIAKSSIKINNNNNSVYSHEIRSGEGGIFTTLPLSVNINDDNEIIWLRDMLGKMYESIGKVKNEVFIKDMLQSKEDLRFVLEQFERLSKGEIVLLGLSSLTTLPVYEADFGWGKPVWVTNASLIYKDLVVLIPAGPSSKDIVAFISLLEEDMANLERDTKFNAFVCNHASSKL